MNIFPNLCCNKCGTGIQACLVYLFTCPGNIEIGIGQRSKLLSAVLKSLSFKVTKTQLSQKKTFIGSLQEGQGHAVP